MNLLNLFSLKTKKVRDKLVIAFSLMSIIPLLIIMYFIVNYVFLYTSEFLPPSIIIFFTTCIAFLGLILIRRIIAPLIDMAIKTKDIAGGKYDTEVKVKTEDELGEIADAINTMRGKMQRYIDELREYGKRTEALNRQIRKKVTTLTNLMQLGDMITAGANLGEVLGFAAEKLTLELDKGFSDIFMKEKTGGYTSRCFANKSGKEISTNEIIKTLPLIDRAFSAGNKYLTLDSRPPVKPWQTNLRKKVKLRNVLLAPMKSGEKIVGVIMLGNFAPEYKFTDDDIRAIQAFEKLLIIGYQASQVVGVKAVKTEEGKVTEEVTELYTQPHLKKTLEEEINRATFYQKACSLIILEVDGFDDYSKQHGKGKAEQALKQAAKIITEAVPPAAKTADLGSGKFGVTLPEKNKRDSIKIAENIRTQIGSLNLSDDPADRITVSAGIGENPIDGIIAEDIMAKATKNLEKAIEQGRNKVVGA